MSAQNLSYSHLGYVRGYAEASDVSGNITAIDEEPNPNFSESFAYDDVNRLISANGPVYGTHGYTYDLAGNRIAGRAGSVNESYGYALGSSRLISVGGGALRSFSYDGVGNVTGDSRGRVPNIFMYNYAYAYDQDGEPRPESAFPRAICRQ